MSAEDAATFVTSHIDSSDIVLVKGSRSITTEKVVAALVAAHGRRVASGEVAR
jgi:UDP-N-acetylmuramyl pentapeptide synthase